MLVKTFESSGKNISENFVKLNRGIAQKPDEVGT